MEDLSFDVGPEFLEDVHRYGEDELLGAIDERVMAGRLVCRYPHSGNRRGCIVTGDIRYVQGGPAAIIVSEEGVDNSVQCPPSETTLAEGDVSYVFVQWNGEARLNVPLNDGYADA